ncbi:helix-turn-helix domain-containing protein [Steroidobacter flavus]|uniref:Helix-turn-helix domain-containing protein n=1 Tax=Steroidobacter flavus TaxID=1842136 RepID=A0ABV8STM9_9GAMM
MTKKTKKAPVENPASAPSSLAASVGASIRQLRTAQGLTLADVAVRANISQAMLSRVETGAVSPSLETVAALAAALGADLPALFRGIETQASDAQLVRKGEGLEVVRRGTKRGHTYHLLASDRGPRKAFEPFLVTLTDKSEIFPEFQHPGTEFIHMLEGSLRYRHGSENYLLKPGDTLTFSGNVPHGPQTLLRLPIRFLSIIIYHDESH